MILYYKYVKLLYINRNNNIIKILFYIFKKHLREKKIVLHFNYLIKLIFYIVKNK